jgi:hypothetical protein
MRSNSAISQAASLHPHHPSIIPRMRFLGQYRHEGIYVSIQFTPQLRHWQSRVIFLPLTIYLCSASMDNYLINLNSLLSCIIASLGSRFSSSHHDRYRPDYPILTRHCHGHHDCLPEFRPVQPPIAFLRKASQICASPYISA